MTLGDHCSVKRVDGRLVLEVPEEALLAYFRHDPEFPRVLDREAFLAALGPQLLQVAAASRDEVFTTALEELFRRAARAAADHP